MKLFRMAVRIVVVYVLLASTAFSDTIILLSQSSVRRFPSTPRRTMWVYPYYYYQPFFTYQYLGSYLEYLRMYGIDPSDGRYMVWTADGKYVGLMSHVWTGDGKELYRLSSVWTADGKDLHALSNVWTASGKDLYFKSNVWMGDGKEITSLSQWTEGFFK